ncbi:MAG TPA: hypothetical protein VKZ92_08835, partial [Pseudohongiella sp.]|nr:hypothetical protein [Pseudohongiella sp.]
MINHFPVLQVILPLMAAPACLFLRKRDMVWLFATAVALLSFAVSLSLLFTVMQNGPVSYELGGWQAPWGIEYRID